MPISVGDKLPEATFTRMGAEGPEQVTLSSLTKGRKVVIFAVPGAFTPTCHSAHVPSFMRTKDAFAANEAGRLGHWQGEVFQELGADVFFSGVIIKPGALW